MILKLRIINIEPSCEENFEVVKKYEDLQQVEELNLEDNISQEIDEDSDSFVH